MKNFNFDNAILRKDSYKNNKSLAVILEQDDEIIAVLTVNLPDSDAHDNLAYIDTNNVPWAEDYLIDNGIAKPTGAYMESGFCEYPLYEFDLSKLN